VAGPELAKPTVSLHDLHITASLLEVKGGERFLSIYLPAGQAIQALSELEPVVPVIMYLPMIQFVQLFVV